VNPRVGEIRRRLRGTSGRGRRLRGLLALLRPYRVRVIAMFASLIVGTAASLAPAPLAKLAIDDGITAGDRRTLTLVVIAFLVAAGVVWVGTYAQTYLVEWVGQRALADLRMAIFDHLQRMPIGFYERRPAGVLISRMTNDVEALDDLVTDSVVTLFQASLTLIGTLVILVALDLKLALLTFTVVPVIVLASLAFRVASADAYRRTRETIGQITGNLQETLSGIRVVRAFGQEPRHIRRFAELNEANRAANMTTVYLNAAYFPAIEMVSALGTVAILIYGGYQAIDGAITIGVIVAFIAALGNFFAPITQLSQLYTTYQSGMAALDKIFELLDIEPSMVEAPDAFELGPLRGEIRFEGVSFAYATESPASAGSPDGRAVAADGSPDGRAVAVDGSPDGRVVALDSIDLVVPAGQTVALVGATGAGKSTFAKLVARFYDPTDGRVLVDGHDLRDVRASSLRRQMGIVPQEAFLFSGTIGENIAFGRPDATAEEIRAAAAAVGADEFIEALDGGYETEVGERGAQLSSGQRQLLAFARALIADPRILVLDEATSNVDLHTEGRIEAGLQRLLAGRTALVIAHRLSTIRAAGRIVVLDGGRIVEQGTHDELIDAGGAYWDLYRDWSEQTALATAIGAPG
jgi:ABC-type multidrug transport system fused ATPase/permease subunit